MVDTRNKRASVLGFALASLVVLPAPDASITQPDRQQVSFSYAGILAEATVTTEPDVITVNAYFRTTVTLEAHIRRTVTVEVER